MGTTQHWRREHQKRETSEHLALFLRLVGWFSIDFRREPGYALGYLALM